MEVKKGRFIDIDNFKLDDFENLFEYLRNSEDYVLDFRYNTITLYNSGRRALGISINKNSYLLQFNFNNADILLKENPDKLTEIVEVLKELSFDVSDYEIWYDERKKYIKLDKTERHKLTAPNMEVKACINIEDIQNYDFKKLLNSINDIFQTYGEKKREEEKHKTRLARKLNTFANDLIVFDTEYEVSYIDEETKQEVRQDGKIVKPDLVALKKVNDNYKIVFIELKTNVKSSIGTSNIIDHIEDNERYKEYYERNEIEREQFKKSVEFILENKIKYGLLKDIDSIETIKDKIDFNEAPELIIMCVLTLKEYVNLSQMMRQQFKVTKRNVEWDNTIIILDKDDNYDLLEENTFKDFIKKQ